MLRVVLVVVCGSQLRLASVLARGRGDLTTISEVMNPRLLPFGPTDLPWQMEMVFAGREAYNILPLHYAFRTDGTLNDLVLLLLGGMWRGVEVRCSGTWLGVEVVR